MYKSQTYGIASTPVLAGLVFMWRFRLVLTYVTVYSVQYSECLYIDSYYVKSMYIVRVNATTDDSKFLSLSLRYKKKQGVALYIIQYTALISFKSTRGNQTNTGMCKLWARGAFAEVL